MPRAPCQVSVIPFRRLASGEVRYAVFQRADGSWQWVAGGAEEGETIKQAAQREAREEAGIEPPSRWMTLDTRGSIPRSFFPAGSHWPKNIYVVPEHHFAVDVGTAELRLSAEHKRFEWLSYEQAQARLTWQSSRTALWELHHRLTPATTPPPLPIAPSASRPPGACGTDKA